MTLPSNGITTTKTCLETGEGTKQIFIFEGALTFETVMELWNTKHQFFASNLPIALDLKAVKRTDSAGLAFLIALYREALHSDKPLTLINIPKQLLDIASVSGVESILPIC